MEGKLLTYILLGIIGVLGWVVVDEKYINPAEAPSGTTDTVYVDKPFKVETIKEADSIVPATITLWETQYDTLEKIELVNDTIKVYTKGVEFPITYDPRFFTSYPEAPKVLELGIEKNKMKFTGQRPDGEVQTNEWPLNLAQNDYRLAPNGNGWVALEADRARGWLGLDFDLNHGIELGTQWTLNQGKLIQDPYFEYQPSLQIKNDISVRGGIGLTPDLFGKVGLGYTFN